MRKFFIILFLFYSSFLFAENKNNFLVENIKINRVDKDANIARQKAITKAQRDAFNTVLNRLSIDDTNGIAITDDEISTILRSIQINNEKITSNSYSATLTIEFNPEYVNYMLKKYRITKFSPKHNSYLIIPILKEDGNVYLWEKNNKWMSLFLRNLKNNNNSVFLIEDDFSSRNLLNKRMLEKPSFNNFKNLAELYNINNIVLIDSEFQKDINVIDIKINIISDKEERKATLKYELENINKPILDFNNASIKIIEYVNNLSKNNNEVNTVENYKESKTGTLVFVPISSLSAFNNVGFDILGSSNSMVNYSADVLLNLSIECLTQSGGGFYIHTETMGRSMIEAISLGTKIYATNVGGIAELFDENESIGALLASDGTTIKRGFDNIDNILREKATNLKDYSWEKVFQMYNNLFYRVAEQMLKLLA